MLRPTDRNLTVLTGLVVSMLFTATSVVAVAYSSGTFDDVYQVTARFDSAGQGLIKQSDVKIRGINIGRVEGVDLDDAGRAVVTLRLSGGEKIPKDARAVVRPKTLFGEKFVDIETTPESEARGPYLEDGDEITETLGSFELEEVLVKAKGLLDAVNPAEVGVILDTLAESGKGEGERIRRQIQNWQQVAAVFAEHDADTREFLTDFETLAGVLARTGDDVTVLAKNLNTVLPKLNAKADKLDNLLDDAADVSRDLADVLERSEPTLEKLVTQGGKALQVLYDNRDQVPRLVVSLRDFSQVLAQAGSYQGNSYKFSGGGKLATIKIVAGVDTLVFLACALSSTSAACTAGKGLLSDDGGAVSAGHGPAAANGWPGQMVGGPPVTEGAGAVVDLLSQTLTGIPVSALVSTGAEAGQ